MLAKLLISPSTGSPFLRACLIIRALLVALHRLDLEALTQQRSQLRVSELVDVVPVVDGLDDLARLTFEAIGDLLKRPALAINQRRVHELFGWRALRKLRASLASAPGR